LHSTIWEEQGFAWRSEWRVPNAPVRGLKREAGPIAHEFYGRPSQSLWLCGVTGTNGKTSCSQWVCALLNRKNIASRVIGTLGSGIPGALQPVANTTPDALETHRLLKQFLLEKAEAVGSRAVGVVWPFRFRLNRSPGVKAGSGLPHSYRSRPQPRPGWESPTPKGFGGEREDRACGTPYLWQIPQDPGAASRGLNYARFQAGGSIESGEPSGRDQACATTTLVVID